MACRAPGEASAAAAGPAVAALSANCVPLIGVTSTPHGAAAVLATPTPAATPEGCYHTGDVTGDGMVTPSDTGQAFWFYIDCALSAPTPGEYCRADYCGSGTVFPCDGSVTPGDALGIFKEYLGYPHPCR